MELRINQGLDERSWDYFILQHPQSNILQSWTWGEFQKAFGHKIWRLAVVDKTQTVAELLTIKLPLKFNMNLLYAPRALLLNKALPAHHQHEAIKLILQYIKKLASKERLVFFRTDPPLAPDDATSLSIYKSLGFVTSPKSTQPKTNLWLDITPKEPNLLLQMKQKTRYNIRLAEKKGIKVFATQNPADIEVFNQLLHETSIRDRFRPHPDEYYQKQLSFLGKHNLMTLFIAHDNHKPLAAALVTFFGRTASYLHGASSNVDREKQPACALHWEIIKAAKQRGCFVYDLGGIHLKPQHNWAGITRFKMGFGGKIVDYAGNLELPLNRPWFKLYQLLSHKKYA